MIERILQIRRPTPLSQTPEEIVVLRIRKLFAISARVERRLFSEHRRTMYQWVAAFKRLEHSVGALRKAGSPEPVSVLLMRPCVRAAHCESGILFEKTHLPIESLGLTPIVGIVPRDQRSSGEPQTQVE